MHLFVIGAKDEEPVVAGEEDGGSMQHVLMAAGPEPPLVLGPLRVHLTPGPPAKRSRTSYRHFVVLDSSAAMIWRGAPSSGHSRPHRVAGQQLIQIL